MSLPIIPQPTNNINNPTKEIWSSSGNIFDNAKYSNRPFANDAPGLNSNINLNTTTTSTTTTTLPPNNLLSKNIPPSADLTNHNYYIDDMLVFNKYIHYSHKIGQLITFDPESFLEQTTKTFNIYSLENR